eukprot:gene5117-5357_t
MCSAVSKPVIRVEVVSDIACPWCWVGKHRLDKAIQQLKSDVDIKVHWLPYQVDPNAPDDGIEKVIFYPRKFGSGRFAQMVAGVQQTYTSERMVYSTGGLMGNTRNAHRLMAWAAAEHGDSKQHELAEQLFHGYHSKEQFINNRTFLLQCVEAVGLPLGPAAEILDDPTGGIGEALVQQEMAKYTSAGGVPSFIVNGKYRIHGAQTHDVFVQVFKELLERDTPAVSAA